MFKIPVFYKRLNAVDHAITVGFDPSAPFNVVWYNASYDKDTKRISYSPEYFHTVSATMVQRLRSLSIACGLAAKR
jgi:hypothetical protein